MKKSSFISAAAIAVISAALMLTARAAENKEVTISGEAKCAKCALHEAKQCQTVIQSEKDGKTITYWLADNSTAKEFHKNVCQDTKKVTAKGTVETKDGKEVFTASKIEEAK